MMSKPHRPNPLALALVFLALAVVTAQGQEEGFRYAQPKQGPKVAKSAKVHRDRTEVTILDTWIVKQSSLPGGNHRDITAIVEDIILYSNGKMRWKYAIYNKGSSRDNFVFDFPNCYVVDKEGDIYQATSWELTQNYGTMTKVGLPASGKASFWIEYDAPARETKQFKVALVCEAGFNTLPNEFAPFRVTLPDPISAGGGKFEPPSPNAHPDEAGGLRMNELADPGTERPGGMTRDPGPSGMTPSRPSSEAAQAVRTASREGRRYEGSIKGGDGGEVAGGILFERRAEDRLVSARIYRKTGPKKETKLVGGIFEELSAPGGLVFRFEDSQEVEYRFTLDGNNMAGTDGRGGRYSFMYKK